jgi:hypothetical protein
MEPVLVKTGNGNPSFLIIAIEPVIKQHVQAQFINPQKIFQNIFPKKKDF